jgi:prolyl oligopeptidase
MMHSHLFVAGVLFTLLPLSIGFANDMSTTSKVPFAYPPAPTSDTIDDYHGTKVADPYRPLENPDSPETRAWIDAENKITFSYLEQIPQRKQLRDRLTQLWNFERYSVPVKENGRYFYTKNDGLQNQSVFYFVDALNGEPRMLLDPNKLSSDGTIAVTESTISDNGKLFAYALSTSGSDWMEWHFRDVNSGKDLSDIIKWSKFSAGAFTKDGKGFFYSRYDEPKSGALVNANYFQKLYFHRIGSPQADDVLIYERPDNKELGFIGQVTEDGRYVVIWVWQGSERNNRFYYKDLSQKDSQVVRLLDDFDAEYAFLGNDGPVFWFRTDLDAPLGRVIAIDTNNPARANWKTIVAEQKEALETVSVVHDTFIASYLKDAHSHVRLYKLDGTHLRDLELPGLGTTTGFTGRRSDTETFYSYQSFTTPATIYRLDLVAGRSSIYRQPKLAFNPSDFETRQVFFTSKDGTRVPMFLSFKKGLKLDGNSPTYLYGYGGFNVSETPAFKVSNLVWMEMGGIFASVNLRGGGEYGKPWHEAGMRTKRQNVFDDFIAAAEYLIANKYTSSPKLAIGGGSNGGLLVGAVMTQRPELFGATLPAVGVMDMLRFHKFTIGWGWVSDYGSSDNPEEFKAIYKYSPLHNIKPGTSYPPTFITTADHDDRVVPAHSFKFAAAMQKAQSGPNPILIRIETKAGHGAGKPVTKLIEEAADRWAFLVKTFNMKMSGESTKSASK